MRKMKDSGIEWIGEIPEEWRITTIGKLFLAKAGGDAKVDLYSDEKDEDHPYPVYTNAFDENQVYAYTSLPVFPKNSITVTGRGDIGHAIFRKTEFDAIIRLNVLTSKFNLCEKYFVYFIDTVIPFFTNSAAVGQLSATQITSYNICFPSFPEQQKISAFLDHKCSEIDSVIEKTKSTIEEYKALKQSVITQAVTKGIRKGRKMKDSGIEWIGEIPEEWIISRVKYVSDFQPFCDTSHLSNDSIITYTPMENIKNGYYIDNKAPFGMVASSLTPYCEGDIVIAKVTPCFENGNISIMNNLSSGFGMGSSELFVVRPKIMLTKYLFYWLQNKQFISIACSTMTGTGGLKRVSPYFFKNSPICLPDNDEQKEISTYLDEKCTAIDTLIAKKEQLLTELESYKKSVIYEYVTGKKEVVDTSVVVINPLTEQALLLCKIKDYLGDELKGRIQALKCLYLIESFVGINFNTQYFRYEHGPYTHNIVNIEKCCMDNGWLTVSKNEHYEYHVGNNHCYCDEYDRLFGTNNSDIEKVLSFIKGMKTSEAERVATLFAVWNDMIIEGQTFLSDSEIIYEVRNNWTPNKAHSPESTWQNTLDKMKRAGIIPKGYGLHTMKKENENEQL